ncbi:MAG: hypothetical protein P8Z30_12485 [Acidobacteriota bacterium]
MMTLPFASSSLLPALWALNFGVILPLALSCLVLIAVIPSAALRGKLNAPAYALILFGAAVAAFFTGKLSGAESVHGTILGVVVSFIFFLLVATAIGCFFGMLIYRQPSFDSESTSSDENLSPSVSALDKDHN